MIFYNKPRAYQKARFFRKKFDKRSFYYSLKNTIITVMKILYVISSTETGGAEKALCQLAMSMQKNGHTVRILCLKPFGSVAKKIQKEGISIISLSKLKFPGRTIKKIKREIISFKPDIVHAMLFRAITYTRMACAGLPVKLITTPHFNLSKKSIFHRWIDFLLKGVDALTIAESRSTADYLVNRQHYPKNKVFFLPNSVDKTRFYQDENIRNSMREKQQFSRENFVFLCVARLSPEKNPLILLQAFRNVLRTCPNSKLVYVGEGEERAKLEKYIQLNNMQKSVLLAGEQKDINDWLNMADAFVLPSLEESLPLALLEALSVGLPCLVSNEGDMPLWVEHGQNGYVCQAEDMTLLSCFMKELSSNADLKGKMAEKSLRKATSIGDSFQQYHQIYQQVSTNSFHVKTN